MRLPHPAWILALLVACAPATVHAQSSPQEPLPEEGKVILACVINDTADGVKNCAVESETPEGFGFGSAALGMAGLFKMKPGKVPGSPIRIPIKFPKENRTATTGSPPSAPSPAADR